MWQSQSVFLFVLAVFALTSCDKLDTLREKITGSSVKPKPVVSVETKAPVALPAAPAAAHKA